jgi:hypothetical protein
VFSVIAHFGVRFTAAPLLIDLNHFGKVDLIDLAAKRGVLLGHY